MAFSAVAWDIDGTLVDSEPRHLRALITVAHRWQVDLTDLPDNAFRGVHVGDVWTALSNRFPARLAFDEWLAAINDAYVADPEELSVIAGAREMIAAIASAGMPQICVSNSNRRIVDANIAALGIGRYLVGSISLDDVSAGKPEPEPYLKACSVLGLDPPRVIAVEDSDTGLQSARRAGLFAVGYSGEAMGLSGADAVIGQLRELGGVLRIPGTAPGRW